MEANDVNIRAIRLCCNMARSFVSIVDEERPGDVIGDGRHENRSFTSWRRGWPLHGFNN
jgi:hypothetical protein